tara:strand:+ start:33 stop:926 length:894 start_codon:yes stop_codon:yes gene_type:complete
MGLTYDSSSTYYDNSSPDYGSYQFISLQEIIDSFKATYVGKGKICENVLNADITFFAIRGMQELSYDTLRSEKDWEIVVPSQLVLAMPHDYVNYVKLSWSDKAGIEHIIYPTKFTSNPTDEDNTIASYGGFNGSATSDAIGNESTTWDNYSAGNPSENNSNDFSYDDDIYDYNLGQRHGIEPFHAQINGSFFIDESLGRFHFSSNLSGKTLVLRYISDGMENLSLANSKIHKFAEEAIYKYMAYGLLSARTDSNPNTLALLKKERFAEQRKAKLRLSNLKIDELTQIMRGKSKWIKH